ncbi:bile acid:sodium symporter family protein [Caulobacter sp. YL-Caulobacter]|uniref:bile acid:sodium symporter n=1 Tax=Caulobacter sp. TaxID=78 RepID=UPI00183B3BA4
MSKFSSVLARLRPDNFTLSLLGTVILASLLPCRGQAATIAGAVTDLAIALLFFLHGAKLSREAILAGIGHWRLHLLVLACTFVLFPVIGLGFKAVPAGLLDPTIAAGLLYLCILPSTVQSSIAFTAIARGNVPAAICGASLSNILGVVLTPILAAVLLGAKGQGGDMLGAAGSIVVQLLVPFVAGHLLRPWIGGFVDRHKKVLTLVDRGSILLVVYTAFSAAVVEGLWRKMGAGDLATILVLDGALLALALGATNLIARRAGLSKADEITLVFCGSKKSLASGVPMAGLLFPAAVVGPMIVPLMLFHQIQLMVCAVLARRYADRPED